MSGRVIPTFENVQRDAIRFVLENEEQIPYDIQLRDGVISSDVLGLHINQDDINEIVYLEQNTEESFPRGGSPLYRGNGIITKSCIAYYMRNDIESEKQISVSHALVCKLSGGQWTVMLPNQALRSKTADNLKSLFLNLAPHVRLCRADREYQRIIDGYPLKIGGLTLHHDKLEYNVMKAGFIDVARHDVPWG